MKKKWWLIFPLLLIILAIGFFVYTSQYYKAEEGNAAAVKTDYGWFFDGPAEDKAIVFYPGALVEETAYAPLLSMIAENGTDVCLVKMPFHLAFFNTNAAAKVMAEYDYKHWYIGGHSLGGAMAANYAANHDLDGIILLAAFPTKAVDEPILIIYGTEDGVVNREKIAQASRYGKVEEAIIDGGNHAGFGNYGEQKGDGKAGVDTAEQQKETAEIIRSWIGREQYGEPLLGGAEIIQGVEIEPETIRAELVEPLLSFFPGTAGSSLRRAAAAVKVLEFADRYEPVEVSIEEENRIRFEENVESVASLLQETKDDFDSVAGLYEDAGVYDDAAALTAKPGIWEKCDAVIRELTE